MNALTPERGQRQGWLWVSPWIVGFIVFLAVPLGLTAYYSLTDYALLESPVYIGAENYRELVGDDLFWITIRNTLIYTAAAVTLGNTLSLSLALLFARPSWLSTVGRAAVFLPTIVPLVAASLAWMWLFNADAGLLNQVLSLIGIEGPNWLGDGRWAMSSLVLMSLWSVGGAFVIYLAALQDIPRQLYEAADIDGVGRVGRLRHVTLPMLSPTILFNVVVGVIWAVQIFAVPYIMTRGGPDNATRFYTMYLYENAFVYGRMGYASAMAWIQLVLIFALTALILRASRRFVHYRGGAAAI